MTRLALLLCFFITGCSAPGSLREVEALKTDLAPYKHLTIQVGSSERNLRDEAAGLSQRLAGKMRKDRVFPQISQGNRRAVEGDVRLTVDFVHNADKDATAPYRAVAEVIRSRDRRRLARLEVPGDDYGVVTAKDPLGRAQESIANRLSRYLKAHR